MPTLTMYLPTPGTLPSSYVHQRLIPVPAGVVLGTGVAVGAGVGVGAIQFGGVPNHPPGQGVGVGDGVGVGAIQFGAVPVQPFGQGVGVGAGVGVGDGVGAVTVTLAVPFGVPQKNVIVAEPAPTKVTLSPLAVATAALVVLVELGLHGPWSL